MCEKIKEIYNQWARNIIPRKVEITWAQDFAYYPAHDPKIAISPLATTENITKIKEYLKRTFDIKFPIERLEYFTWCFLHEVGHHYTYRYLTEEEKTIPEPEEWEAYRKTPAEIAADRWAVEHLNKNWEHCEWWQDYLLYEYEKVTQEELQELLERVFREEGGE